jgi:tetratricopeptide (TPR) repeat protein
MLKDITRTKENSESWDNIKGSAMFYRSYYFLCLLWNYAKAYDSTTAGKDLGIALRLTSNFNVPSTRASNKECYNQIINDTKASLSLLPPLSQHTFRPSKAAAYGLLARCYLSMRQYDKALLYADSCLRITDNLMNYNSDQEIDVSNPINPVFKRFNKETIFYTEMNYYFYFYITSGDSRIDTSLIQLYSSDDMRLLNFYSKNSDSFYSFTGSYSGNNYTMFSGIATDEMYLTRAECYIRKGEINKGLNDINTLLETRYKESTYVPYEETSQQEALNLVLEERRKELVMRGSRWMDLKRLNKEGSNITLRRKTDEGEYVLLPNANFYALPIPEDIIKLTGMPQNDL